MYLDFMEEYASMGHMSSTDNRIPDGPHYFIPNQCVLRPQSTSTKLRVVFDASSRTSTQVALNDILMVGPTIQEELYSTLLWFRMHRFALAADIKKMYRQVMLDEADRNYQLIVWRRDPSESLKIFRFVSRRGIPEKVWCDNATNFVGADRHLREFRARLEEQGAVSKHSRQKKGCEFAFIPPRAPHFGGIWEAGVKSAKHLFLRTVGHDLLTAEELGTLLASVEAVLNSRPIGALSSDPSDGEALTPGHLLIGGPLVAPPPSALPDQISPTCLRRWRSVSSLRHRFWQRWSQEYVSSLQTRQKWSKEVHNVDVGALVVVGEDNLPPQQWRIGRVVAVHVGADGKVRVADIKTADGVFRRAIHRLALLPALS
ncbi:uncharacterized protein LOC122320358 [Drosophila ficusphila]|uniref:uncharacterized protein LOC122320358 n=1 Tax=Drosophila ficusphila TaxID=30025 RepID=UPI001C8951A5|nr:uncharacterized protein LOC122320358 [Drosophila ficusphila]